MLGWSSCFRSQWVAAGLAYALWSWGNELVLLPSEFWWLQDVLDFLWAIACLALALWPIGFFNARIGAVHFLRMEGEPSTMLACMRRSQPRTRALWTLGCVDAALHAIQVLERIPHGRHWTAERLIEREALHYAWKVGTGAVALPEFASGLFWLWAPVIGAIGVVHLLIRPASVVASSELYHGYAAHPS